MHCFCIVRLRGRRGGGGRRVAGEATRVHAGTRAGSVCETAGKPVKGGGWLVLVGWRSRGAESGVLLCCLVRAVVSLLLSQVEFGSAHSFSLL